MNALNRPTPQANLVRVAPPAALQWQAELMLPASSPVFGGHYPGNPLVPGVYLVEAALQALALAGGAPRVRRVLDLRLMHSVGPGQVLRLMAHCIDSHEGGRRWQVSLARDETLVARFKLEYERAAAVQPALTPAPEPDAGWRHWDAARIASRLAHRSPILLVDEAHGEPGGQWLLAHKLISLNEPCFAALPPRVAAERLQYPDVLVLESLVQASGLLVGDESRIHHQVMLLGGVRSVEFHAPAAPGDVLRHELRVLRRLGDTALVGGVTRVGSRLVAVVNEVLIALRSPGALHASPATVQTAATAVAAAEPEPVPE